MLLKPGGRGHCYRQGENSLAGGEHQRPTARPGDAQPDCRQPEKAGGQRGGLLPGDERHHRQGQSGREKGSRAQRLDEDPIDVVHERSPTPVEKRRLQAARGKHGNRSVRQKRVKQRLFEQFGVVRRQGMHQPGQHDHRTEPGPSDRPISPSQEQAHRGDADDGDNRQSRIMDYGPIDPGCPYAQHQCDSGQHLGDVQQRNPVGVDQLVSIRFQLRSIPCLGRSVAGKPEQHGRRHAHRQCFAGQYGGPVQFDPSGLPPKGPERRARQQYRAKISQNRPPESGVQQQAADRVHAVDGRRQRGLAATRDDAVNRDQQQTDYRHHRTTTGVLFGVSTIHPSGQQFGRCRQQEEKTDQGGAAFRPGGQLEHLATGRHLGHQLQVACQQVVTGQIDQCPAGNRSRVGHV